MRLTMEGLPSGDIQAKYQKLAAEYSKVNCLRYFQSFTRSVGNRCKFIVSVHS